MESLPDEAILSIPCLNCGALIDVPESKVRYGWGRDGAEIKTVTKNRCRDCEREHSNIRHDKKREFEHRYNELIKTKNRGRVTKKLEKSVALKAFMKLNLAPRTLRADQQMDARADKLFDRIEEDVRGRHDYVPFTPKLDIQALEQLLATGTEVDGPVRGPAALGDYKKECGRQRRLMNGMRARGEIPMASMFPQINVYHRPEEHIRLGLDVDQKCDECCAVPGKSKEWIAAQSGSPPKAPRPRRLPTPVRTTSAPGALDEGALARLRARLGE